MSDTDQFSLEELCVLSGLPKRTVRYYIQQGLVARPVGETRAARYGRDQLAQLLEIQKWQRAGLSLERIAELLQGGAVGEVPPPRPRGAGTVEVWSHLVLGDGVELHVEPGRAQLSPEQVRELMRRVRDALESIQKESE
jgi:DNA-binding transcriptional MerR regulator